VEIVQYEQDAQGEINKKVPRAGLFFAAFRANHDASFKLCEKLSLDLAHEIERSVESGAISHAEEFAKLSERAVIVYRQQARGPCREQFQEKLGKEIGHQKNLFIQKNKVSELEQANLEKQQALIDAIARADALNAANMEAEKQRAIEMENWNNRFIGAQEQARQEREELIKHHAQVQEKMQKEHAELLDKKMAEAAQQHAQQMATLAEQQRAAEAKMEERIKDDRAQQDRMMEFMRTELAESRKAAEEARQQAAEANNKAIEAIEKSKQQDDGGGFFGGLVKLVTSVVPILPALFSKK